MTKSPLLVALLLMFMGKSQQQTVSLRHEITVTSDSDSANVAFDAMFFQSSGARRFTLTTPHSFKTESGHFVLFLSPHSREARLNAVMKKMNGGVETEATGRQMTFFSVNETGSGGVFMYGSYE